MMTIYKQRERERERGFILYRNEERERERGREGGRERIELQ
jgi:hypothetical protein